jgi:hypothetical protein
METMITKQINVADVAGVGPKLLAHSKSADFSARRGLVVELFPFIFGAAERMSARAMSQFLEKEQGIRLSAVTINKALNDPAKNWNLFFDLIEPAACIFEKDGEGPMGKFLFREQIFLKPIKNKFVKAALKSLLKAEVAQAASILREKWYAIDLEIRLKARPFLEHRLGKK